VQRLAEPWELCGGSKGRWSGSMGRAGAEWEEAMRIGPSVTEMALGTLWVGSLRLDGQGAWGVSAAL